MCPILLYSFVSQAETLVSVNTPLRFTGKTHVAALFFSSAFYSPPFSVVENFLDSGKSILHSNIASQNKKSAQLSQESAQLSQESAQLSQESAELSQESSELSRYKNRLFMNKTVSYDNKPLKFVSTTIKNQVTKATLFIN